MKYKFKKGWKRWNAGDAIDYYEYKRLPIEIKQNLLEEIPPQDSEEIAIESKTSEIPVPKIKNLMEGAAEEKMSSFNPPPDSKEEIKRVIERRFKPNRDEI